MCSHELSCEDQIVLEMIQVMQPSSSATAFEGEIYVYGDLLDKKKK